VEEVVARVAKASSDGTAPASSFSEYNLDDEEQLKEKAKFDEMMKEQMASEDPQAQAEAMLKMKTARVRRARCVSPPRAAAAAVGAGKLLGDILPTLSFAFAAHSPSGPSCLPSFVLIAVPPTARKALQPPPPTNTHPTHPYPPHLRAATPSSRAS
jgi:hypothetical protein